MTRPDAPMNGNFRLIDDRTVYGSLLMAGRNSLLSLFDDQKFPPVPEAYRYLAGDLHDGEIVTLFDCVLQSVTNRYVKENQVKSSARFFPNTVIIGPRHVPREDACVSEVSVLFKDAHSVFYDFDAFSTVLRPEPFIPLLEEDKARIRSVQIGKNPIIGYFTGRYEIASFLSVLGQFSARHRVSETMGGPAGWRLDGQVAVSLELDEPLTFKDAIRRVHALIRFFEFIIGRRQELRGVEIRLQGQAQSEGPLRVVEAHATHVKNFQYRETGSPGPCDVLLCTSEGPAEFCSVAKNYFDNDDTRLDSRVRLAENIRRDSYTVDRLVSAANMFDILPKLCYPSAIPLSDESIKARDDARQVFKALPASIERDSVLNALGRMGEMTLKRKVLARLDSSGILSNFPGLDDVLKEAVNCRNHYVHGSPGKIDYVNNLQTTVFFTDALEFVFGIADLVDCGWSFDRWAAKHPQPDHPFGAFRLAYRENYKLFLELMDASP